MAIKLTDGTRNALGVLSKFEDFTVLNDLKGASDENIASAHLTSLVRNGLAEVTDIQVEVVEIKTYKGYRVTDAGKEHLASLADGVAE